MDTHTTQEQDAFSRNDSRAEALAPGPSHHSPSHMIGTGVAVVIFLGAATLLVGYQPAELVQNLSYPIGLMALSILSVGICLVLIGKSDEFPGTGHWLVSLMGLGLIVSTILASKLQNTSPLIWLASYYLPPLILGSVYLLVRLRFWQAPLACIALSLPSGTFVTPWLHEAWAAQPETQAESEPTYSATDAEVVYETQPILRRAAFENLHLGDPSRVELFSILGAGYPYERVFRREVLAVNSFLASAMDGTGKSIVLVNDARAPTDHLLMNRTNLKASAEAMGARMDADDILLIFLTSHGRPGALSTQYYGLINYDLTPDDINEALIAAGDPASIIIVSACYSGSFVAPLAAPHRLVLTAADAESVSFGCSDENEWTEWGRAFWLNAMNETRDFRDAATRAKTAVSQRERREGLDASDPMISEGVEIGERLDRLLADSQG